MTTITLTRHVPVSPAHAYRAWIEPAELARWWWPQWPDTQYAIDPREGGEYRFYSAAVGMGVAGTLSDVDPPHGFTMTWIWLDEDGPARVDGVAVIDTVVVTFVADDDGDGTVVTVEHRSVEDLTEGGSEQGWNDVLDRLPAHLAG
jgi:uncharacterized protein YndB with AHSA1/START domain